MKLLMVSVGRGRYAVAADALARIADTTSGSEARRVGSERAVTVHGVSYPVVDLHGMLGETPSRSCVYLVLEGKDGRAVLPVDKAEEIHDIPATAIAPLPSFIFAGARRLFRGLFSDGHESRLLLDASVLL
ncbi:MAG TPA: chemotaxis protein CheW [Candidatus Polarisedimenticolia bacterium]|nr:chemotaxis protein CheW [Candidatus Polarisedimenticolia bacterium]